MATIIDDDCNIPQKKCETSAKYTKDDIVDIADKCGVDIYNEKGKLKTRKQLCKEIAEKQQETVQPFVAEVPLPPITIPEPVQVPVVQRPLYTEDILKKNTKVKLLEIAEDLGIKKWKNKGIKGYNKPDIIEAILTAVAVEEPLPVPLPEPTIIVVEDDSPVEVHIEVIEKPDKKTLNKKTKKQLLEYAKEYGIKTWKGKNINYQNKPDIIDAIIDYFETNVAPTVVPSPPRTPIRSPPRTPRVPGSPMNIQELIKQKRQELLKVLKLKEQEQCNPLEGKYCSDNNVCDINKKPNTCISKEEAVYKENKGLVNMFNIGNKHLIGTKKQEYDLYEKLGFTGGVEESKEPVVFKEEITIKPIRKPTTKKIMCNVCTYVNDPDTIECIICNSDLTEEEINNVILPEDTYIIERDVIPEGTKITELENIEDILNEIQKNDDTKINLEGLDEAKKKVLYCLGLLN